MRGTRVEWLNVCLIAGYNASCNVSGQLVYFEIEGNRREREKKRYVLNAICKRGENYYREQFSCAAGFLLYTLLRKKNSLGSAKQLYKYTTFHSRYIKVQYS